MKTTKITEGIDLWTFDEPQKFELLTIERKTYDKTFVTIYAGQNGDWLLIEYFNPNTPEQAVATLYARLCEKVKTSGTYKDEDETGVITDPQKVRDSVHKYRELEEAECICPLCGVPTDLVEMEMCEQCGTVMCWSCTKFTPQKESLCPKCYQKRLDILAGIAPSK